MPSKFARWFTLQRRLKYVSALPLYFLHIPKTAGTSVLAWLHAQLGNDAVCPARIWDDLALSGERSLLNYRAYAGHFGVDLEGFANMRVRSVSVFRDPIARTLSHYGHVFRNSDHPYHAYVSRQSFKEFVEDAHNWPMIEDFQARYLVKTPISLSGCLRHYDKTGRKQSRLSVLCEDARYLLDKKFVREMSLEAFDSLDVVGTTDRLPEFLSAVATVANFPELCGRSDAPHENVGISNALREQLDEEVVEKVRSLTTVDQELYDAARVAASTCGRTP